MNLITKKITHQTFGDMFESLIKIGNISGIEFTMEVARMIKENNPLSYEVSAGIQQIQTKHATTHPDGRIVTDPNTGQVIWKNKEAFDLEFKQFADTEAEVRVIELPYKKYSKDTWKLILANLIVPLLDVVVITPQEGLRKV